MKGVPMKLPRIKSLLTALNHLADTYNTERKKKDANRFLGSIRSNTNNPVRHMAIEHLQSLGSFIKDNKAYDLNTLSDTKEYRPILPEDFDSETDDELGTLKKVYEKDAITRLKQALAGAIILTLHDIYDHNKNTDSALGKELCRTLDIPNISAITLNDEKKLLGEYSTLLKVYHDNFFSEDQKEEEALIKSLGTDVKISKETVKIENALLNVNIKIDKANLKAASQSKKNKKETGEVEEGLSSSQLSS